MRDESDRTGGQYALMRSQLLRLKHICEMRPRDPLAFRRFGESLAAFGRLEEAAAAYRRCLVLKPDEPVILNQLGVVLYRQKHFPAAVETFRRLLGIAPRYAIAYYHFGLCLTGMGLVEDAIRLFEVAVQLSPKSEAPRLELAAACHRAGRLEKALAEYSAAYELNTRNFTILERMVDIHEALGDVAEALSICRSIVEASRNHPRHDGIKATYLRLVKLHRERAEAEKEGAGDAGGGSYLDFLNSFGQEALPPATEANLLDRLEHALETDPDDLDAMVELASVYESCGDALKAIAMLKRIVELQKCRLVNAADVPGNPDLP